MARYTKISSKYILAKRHQNIAQGTLYERDWTTIGNVHRLEPGKRPYYGDGNFLFTESTIPVYKKRRKTGKWVGNYTYNDVKDATEAVNIINVNTDSDNLTDYAYWGSMTELFRGSVEHIVATFPGRLRSTHMKFSVHWHRNDAPLGPQEYWEEVNGYILANPYNLDMHNEFQEVSQEDILRYVALCWNKYFVDDFDNGTQSVITYYEIVNTYYEFDCEGRYFRLCTIYILAGKNAIIVDTYLADGKIVYVYRTDDGTIAGLEFLITYHTGLPDDNRRTITSSVDEYITRALSEDSVELSVPDEFAIRPSDEVVEEYFRTLKGFEWKLLNRRTNPLYQNVFLYPSQGESGNWYLTRRKYTWPSEGYWIDIESTDYDTFVANMIDLCEAYDNLWCDSIWRCMVHESVKNFDWSYRREYDDSDEVDNIEGGNRMKDVMRLYGIIYDTAKRYVDGISIYNNVTYDGYNNCPSAQISDRNMLLGWDITSTQHQFYWYSEIEGRMPSFDVFVSIPVLPINVDEDSPEFVVVTCSNKQDSRYYQKHTIDIPTLSLSNVFTESVGKQDNPWVTTNAYGRLYVEIGYGSIPQNTTFDENNTYNEFPYALFSDETLEEYIKVVSNSGTKYYQLINEPDFPTHNEGYVNGTWFTTRNENTVTPETTDILFNRMLNLSANRILKTKGTREAVEMVMALFGFGLYDIETNPYGDFTIEEQHRVFGTKDYDSTFYFYEEVDEEATGGGAVSYDSIPVSPDENSDEYISVQTIYGDSAFTTYYRLNGEYTVSDVIRLLYAHRTTEREYDNYYSGVPLKDVYVGGSHLIVPFHDTSLNYECDFYFESRGGWMKDEENYGYTVAHPEEGQISEYVESDYLPTQVTADSEEHIYVDEDGETVYYDRVEIDKTWAYTETIPYLHILQRISDLLSINTNGVNDNDIYYVADVSDYYTYSSASPYYLSNFFKLKDKYNASAFSSWVNIPIEGPIKYGYSGVDGVTVDDYRHAKHLDSIIPTILFNNPHCGYDRYDMGDEFTDYMQHPYKYSVENDLYDDEYYRNMASQFSFAMETVSPSTKMDIVANTYSIDNEDNISTHLMDIGTSTTNINDKLLKIRLIDAPYGDLDTTDTSYRMHLEYMRNVVMKYVAQVIPSTTMLVLEDFVPSENIANEMATITVNINEPGFGVVYGAGTYLKSTMVTLKAVPSEGYHFVGWTWSGGRAEAPGGGETSSGYTTEEITVMVCGDKTFTANFAEDCGIGFGCAVINCGYNPPVSS